MVDLSLINQKIKEIKFTRSFPTEVTDNHENLFEQFHDNPFEQFKEWFWEALSAEKHDPRVMVLATIGSDNLPSTRAIAVQELQENQFIFYSAYDGRKGVDIDYQNNVAGNFYWPDLARQINIKARIIKTSRQKSENYFANRDKEIQVMMHAWKQSIPVASPAVLEEKFQQALQQFGDKTIPCPTNWGGYIIEPIYYEFYQRRKDLKNNEVIAYNFSDNTWQCHLLTP